MSCLVVGNHTQGLGIVRSLGRNGIKPHVLYDKHVSLARFSRYCSSFNLTRHGSLGRVYRNDVRDIVQRAMLSLVPEKEKWVLFGVSEDIINFFYARQDALRSKFLFPENDIADITDKYVFARRTKRAGVQSPDTYLLSEFDSRQLIKNRFVAKGRTGNKFRNIGNIKGLTVADAADLARIRQYVKGRVGENEVILQQLVESDSNIHSCCGFSVDGELLVVFIYEKVRQAPDQFGTGTFSISRNVSEIREKAQAIIAELNYTGIFEIEFLKDKFSRCFVAIEMNPRTWKSIDLSTACNKNLCLNYYHYLREGKIPTLSLNVPDGKQWAHLAVDFVHMLKNGGTRFGYSKDIVFCDLSMDDPLPFAAQVFLLPLIKLEI